jgi:hypothetical protein
VQLDDGLLLLCGEVAALQVRPQVVDPPQPAALPAPQQSYRQNKEPISKNTQNELKTSPDDLSAHFQLSASSGYLLAWAVRASWRGRASGCRR